MMTSSAPELFDGLCQQLHASPDRRGHVHIDCPWCGKEVKRGQTHFSFSERGFKCFVCGEGGGLWRLAEQLQVTPVVTTVRPVRVQEQPKPRYWQQNPNRFLQAFLEAPTRLTDWQSYKPLTIESISRWQLGVGPLPNSRCQHPRLILPVYRDGKVVALHGRAYRTDDHDAKWLTAGGSTKDVLFNAELLTPGCTVVICENMIDAILSMQTEPGIVAVSGGGVNWREEWTARLVAARPSQVICWLDHDLAGNGSRYHHAELVAEWFERNPKATYVPDPAGPKIANELLAAGLKATVYTWPMGTPIHADLGWALMPEVAQ